MVLSKGEKVFVIIRRLFEKDLRRHFIGEILEVSPELMRVSGYAFIFNENDKEFRRRGKLQTNIFSLVDAGVEVIVLPEDIIIDEIWYTINEKGHRIITDRKSFHMRVSEFGANI